MTLSVKEKQTKMATAFAHSANRSNRQKRKAEGTHKQSRTENGRRQAAGFPFVKIARRFMVFGFRKQRLFGLALIPAGLAGSGAAAPKAKPKRQPRRLVIERRRSIRRQLFYRWGMSSAPGGLADSGKPAHRAGVVRSLRFCAAGS